MAYHAHSLTEWAEMLSLAVAVYAACSAGFFLLVDADLADFDPRPALHRLVESGRLDLLVEVTRTRQLLREAAVSAAALLMLLTAAPEATR